MEHKCRRFAHQVAKLIDHVRLIVIAGIEREAGPIDALDMTDPFDRGLQSPHTREHLRAESDLSIKPAREMLPADA
jgi:hypothetical protein